MPSQPYVYNLANEALFTYNSSLIEFLSDRAALKLLPIIDAIFNEDFADDTDFVYDNTKAEFLGGLVRQKDLGPVGDKAWASFTTDEDFDGGEGVLTGTLAGAAAVSGGKLSLTGTTNATCTYNGVAKINAAIGAIKFKWRTDFIGNSPGAMELLEFANSTGVNNNRFEMLFSTNSIRTNTYNADGSSAGLGSYFGAYAGVSPEVEVEVNWDFKVANKVWIFFDGVLQGEVVIAATRSDDLTSVAHLRFGDTAISKQFMDDIVIYDTVQHTSGYTPGYILPSSSYEGSVVQLPPFSGNPTGYTAFATTESGSVKYILDGKYHNGANWVSSDGTWAQANTETEVDTNIATLAVVTTLYVKIIFEDGDVQGSVSDLSVTYDGNAYTDTSPSIVIIDGVVSDGLLGLTFPDTPSEPSGTSIKGVIVVDDIDMYYNTGSAAWEISSGVSQSNTKTEIDDNAASLDLSSSLEIKYKAYLISDGGQTPEIISASVEYDFSFVCATFDKCIVYGCIRDSGGIAISGATVTFVPTKNFENGTLVAADKTATTDSNGKFDVEIVESASVSATYSVVVVANGRSTTYIDVIVPSEFSVDITDILP